MNITHIEHIGIAVKDLSQAIPYYENVLGLKCYNIEEVADQKAINKAATMAAKPIIKYTIQGRVPQ